MRFGLEPFLRPHVIGLLGALLLVIVETMAIQAGPFLTKIAIDDGIKAGKFSVVQWATVGFLVSVVLSAIAGNRRIAYTGRLGEKLMYALRIRVFTHLSRQSLGFYTQEKAGVLMTRMTSDVEALSVLFQEGLVNFAVQVLTLVVIAIVLFDLQHQAGDHHACGRAAANSRSEPVVPEGFGSTAIPRCATPSPTCCRICPRASPASASSRRTTGGGTTSSTTSTSSAATSTPTSTTARANGVYAPGSESVGVLGQALILVIGGRMVLRDELTVGELAAFFLYLTAFFAPIQQPWFSFTTPTNRATPAIVKLRELFDTEPEVGEALNAIELPPIDGAIELDNVTFGYSADRPVLHDVNLRIAAGESVAIVGSTGAGKSTIAKLVARFYDPQGGRVLLDGHDIRGVTISSLRRQLGVVPQEPFLFHGTLRTNVAFADPQADEATVRAACSAVGLDDLVDRLPQGLDTEVHERGSSLSAGERQLLALARAFVAKPRVLVLDEATSNLDLTSEAKIERALDTLLEGRTAIIIAHRLATAMRCDRIAVVEDGSIVELGSHAELVAAGGRYAELYRTWQSHMGLTD